MSTMSAATELANANWTRETVGGIRMIKEKKQHYLQIWQYTWKTPGNHTKTNLNKKRTY